MKFTKCLENRRFPCYNNTNAKSVPSGAQANRTGSGRAYMNCAEIRRLPWLIRLLTSALLAALVLTPAPLALSASRTRPLSMLLLVLTAVLAKVLAPLVQSSRNNHSVPNPLCSVCCAGDFLMQKFIDDLIQALYRRQNCFCCCGTGLLHYFTHFTAPLPTLQNACRAQQKMFSSLHKLYGSMVDTG